MYICCDCGALFEDPNHYVDQHGFSSPPYEEWGGCPKCSGAYVEAYICDGCGEYITDGYIKTDDGNRYCMNCFISCDLGDE